MYYEKSEYDKAVSFNLSNRFLIVSVAYIQWVSLALEKYDPYFFSDNVLSDLIVSCLEMWPLLIICVLMVMISGKFNDFFNFNPVMKYWIIFFDHIVIINLFIKKFPYSFRVCMLDNRDMAKRDRIPSSLPAGLVWRNLVGLHLYDDGNLLMKNLKNSKSSTGVQNSNIQMKYDNIAR